ncbi:hypothetical protein DJFAAGMI_01420 [Comamonas sp. PE63]|uniref:Uncharacterized protein n=1 Tax=Comamonas brasiliensis TaxID=1812482 RepID=A0ABS5LQC5_9BURK|nr:hypothetical protein [Comamonas sp. PE63]MBS3018688.1 hypothetical protein [Comamonas sp. PE63]
MPILQGDIQLRASRVMDDVPEGGGGPSNVVIESGQENAIMPDVSEMDRALGRDNMRQMFVGVDTEDRDTYQGSNVIVAKPPEDPNISITLFATGGVYDTRAQAQARLEAYLNKGPEWAGYLYEDHIQGQRVIQIFQRPGTELPAVGKTLVLVGNEGLVNEQMQYVRAIRVTSKELTFTYDTDKDYKAVIVSVEISDALRYAFTGSPASRQFMRLVNSARLRDTVVADAGSYVGVTPLQKAAALGDFTIIAKTIMTQIVPSAQSETPIPATIPYAAAGFPISAAEAVTFSTAQTWNTTTSLALPGGCLPGSLSIVVGGVTLIDKGGILMSGTQQIGLVDYANGIVTSSSGSYDGSKTISYRPAAYMQRMPQSSEIRITAENRSQSYTGFITPLPARGTLSFSYRAQGRWYVLSDSGDGTLRGTDSSYGAGTYSAETGSFVVTLGALPDVGSSIVQHWGVPTQETVQPAADLLISQTIALALPAGQALYPGAFSMTWMDGTNQRTATATAAWQLQGDATGEVRVGRSEVLFAPKLLPAVGTVLDVTVDTAPAVEVNLQHPSRNGQGRLAVSAGQGALVPFTVEVEWNTLTDQAVLGVYTRDQLKEMGVTLVDPTQIARDDGNGKLMLDGVQVGTVNYSTGAVDFNPDVVIKIPKPVYSSSQVSGGGFNGEVAQYRLNYEGIEYLNAPSIYPNDESGYVKIRFRTTGSATRRTLQVVFAPEFDLVTGVQAPVVPGSVVLMPSSGQPWSDDGRGLLRVLTSGGFVTRGSINYATGRVGLISWTTGNANTLRRAGCITTLGDAISSAYVFRTAAAPLRPGSLTVQVSRASGGSQNVSAGIDGTITATGVVGTVDYETGLVRLGFGALVVAAGNESEPWYDAANVQPDGKIFKPQPVVASALRYTAVAYAYLPMNADIIGIDPVRLPSDGKVPIFRPGTLCVVGHTKTSNQLVVSNNMTVNLARVRLSRVVVRDANGKTLNAGYSVDLEAGLVTFTDVSAMTMPVTIEDRIEDMAVATDVQIAGEITFNRALTHDYPKDGTYVSSALQASDRFARVSLVFEQQTWIDNAWADAPSGPGIAAKYDQSVSPIEITNAGGSTERWVLQFTSTSQFRVIGEHVGVIATGDINSVCSPVNPATGKPYFTIKPLGWGSGWAVGNILRMNTVGAIYPFWVVRTIQPGPETGIEHSFSILARGDVNRPQSV